MKAASQMSDSQWPPFPPLLTPTHSHATAELESLRTNKATKPPQALPSQLEIQILWHSSNF